MGIGEKIKLRRAELGMTLEDVAKVVGTTRATIQKYENGIISNIPLEKVELLAVALRTSPAYLMGWETSAADEIPQQEYREELAGQGVRLLLDASANLTKEQLDEIVSFIKYQQAKNDRT